MTLYRLFCLDDQMRIGARQEIEAISDAEAVEAARLLMPHLKREIWDARRKVAVLAVEPVPEFVV